MFCSRITTSNSIPLLLFGIEHLMRSFTNLVWKPFDGVEPHCSMTFLEIFSLKKFSRVVVYCSVIKVPVVLSQATALIFYQIRSALSRTFFFFFSFRCLSRVSFNILPLSAAICQLFFTVFSTFFSVFISLLYMVVLHDIIHHSTYTSCKK